MLCDWIDRPNRAGTRNTVSLTEKRSPLTRCVREMHRIAAFSELQNPGQEPTVPKIIGT
jgi:hypothetical protein